MSRAPMWPVAFFGNKCMNYEKPQKGNPHKLTIKQHILPARSIARFVDDSGRVSLFSNKAGKLRVKPDDQIFCAKRAWDQRAESGYMKNIEDRYQALADSIICGFKNQIGFSDNNVITDMYALWNIRSHRGEAPILDQEISGDGLVCNDLSKDDQEVLEGKHVGFIRADLTMPGRMLAGLSIQMNLNEVRGLMKGAQWGVWVAKAGEFLVPDNFSNARVMPLTPRCCLVSDSGNVVAGIQEVRKINRLALDNVLDFWFARDERECPV